ncbi:MAG: hypothetical protein JST32_19850, partial [Bacteroidetes bacterium]|nr:hypothetical protein [Bacteroidota bacterium]
TAQEAKLVNLLNTKNHALAGRIAADYLNRIPKEAWMIPANGQLMLDFQDNQQVTCIAVDFIQGSKTKDNMLSFIRAVSGRPKVKGWADSTISTFTQKDMADKINRQLINIFKADPKVKSWVGNYIMGLPKNELTVTPNRELAASFKKDSQIRAYINTYINGLTENDLYTYDNIRLLQAFADTSVGRGFNLFYKHSMEVDTFMHEDGFSKSVINPIVTKELISPEVTIAKKTGMEPDWVKICHAIKNRFGKEYVENNVTYARMKWYLDEKDGQNCAKYMVQWLRKIYRQKGIAGSHLSPEGFWNDRAFYIFMYDGDKNDLQEALGWIKDVNALQKVPVPMSLDTEANLLYKLNRNAEAIEMESQAAQLDSKHRTFADTLHKMKAGEPTWSVTGRME